MGSHPDLVAQMDRHQARNHMANREYCVLRAIDDHVSRRRSTNDGESMVDRCDAGKHFQEQKLGS